MDPQTNLSDLVEDLEVNIDELTHALEPLLSAPFHTTASSLPLLDKAKLYVLAAYSVESLLFSALQANGVNAKQHAIFAELARLKGYFGKIKEVEERDLQPKTRLDVGAAQRFIKHGLAGNDKYDVERAERIAKERARAALKAKQINKKFDERGEEQAEGATSKKRSAKDIMAGGAEEQDGEDEEDEEEEELAEVATKPAQTSKADPMESNSASSSRRESSPTKAQKHKKRKSKKAKRSEETIDTEGHTEAEAAATSTDATPKKKKDRKRRGTNQSNMPSE